MDQRRGTSRVSGRLAAGRDAIRDPIGAMGLWLTSAAACLLMAGCQTPAADSSANRAEVPLRDSFAAAVAAEHVRMEPVSPDWLGSFGDARMTEIVGEAVSRNWTLAGASERLEQARLLAARAGAALTPAVDVVAGAGHSDPGRGAASRTALRLGVAASWELDVWGRVRAAQRGAQADARAIEADYASLTEAIAAQAAQSYVLLVLAHQQVALDQDLLAVRARTLSVAEARLEAGVAQPIDVRVARADVRDSEALLRAGRQTVEDAQRSLEVLLGRYPAAEITVTSELPGPPAQVPVGMPSELLERRADVVAADRRVAAAFYRTEEARAARLPRLALTGEFGTASSELRDVLNPESVVWSIGANLVAPIFDGDQRRIDVAITESRQREAMASYVEVVIRAFGEVEAALSAEASLAEQAAILENSVAELTKARDAAELRYRRGLLTIFELTQVEARLFAARRDLLAVRGASVIQRIELHRALGGSFAEVQIGERVGGGEGR